MSDGNKRILGDVWINQENLDRQREFFQDIIESYQDKYGGQFDASTLQGLQASDFATAEQGVLATHAIQDPLWLGKKRIENIVDRQYIYSDAVLIDRDQSDENSSSYEITNIDWFDAPVNNLTDALVKIYNKIIEISTNLNETKLDSDEFDNFVDTRFKPIEDQYDESRIEFIDHTTGGTKQGLNADLVNGIRPILITQDEYNRLSNSQNQDDLNVINDWRNFFIFVDSLPSTYNQPWEYSLTDPYSFRINDNYLQVKNNIGTTWTNVAPLQDFLTGANFDDTIQNFIEDTSDFEINSTSLLNSLENLSTTDINENWDDYPFLSSDLHNNFISQITCNDTESPYITETIDNNQFKNIDIDLNQALKDAQVLNNDGTPKINGIQNTLTTYGSDITDIQQSIFSISDQINNNIIPDELANSRDINDIKTQLSQISNQLATISNNLQNSIQIGNKSSKGWVEYTPTHNGSTDRWGQNASFMYYNRDLALAWFRIDWLYDYKVKNKGKWIEDKNVWFDIGVDYCKPIGNLILTISEDCFLKFDYQGKMYHKAYYTADKDVSYDITSPVYATKWW